MPRFDQLPVSLAPRGLGEDTAAQYVGLGSSKFRELVNDGRMPQPIRFDGRKIWDRVDLDDAMDAIKGKQA